MTKQDDVTAPADSKLEDFAEELGRLLGTARARAEGWLNQKQTVAEQLAQIRDTASDLLAQITGGSTSAATPARRGGRGRPAAKRSAARSKTSAQKNRKSMSAEARAKIAAAQKARWARQKAGEKQ